MFAKKRARPLFQISADNEQILPLSSLAIIKTLLVGWTQRPENEDFAACSRSIPLIFAPKSILALELSFANKESEGKNSWLFLLGFYELI